MSRGRKPKVKVETSSWQQIFNKNVGFYFQHIIIELSKVKVDQKETGAELLKKIKTEKELLIKERKLKKESVLNPLEEEEFPFSIPKNWTWCKLGEMSINCDGARIPISQSERERKDRNYDYYGASGVIDKIDGFTHEGKYLLIGEDGANLKAKSTPIAFIAEGKFWVNNHAHVLNFFDDITFDYMEYCLNSIDINSFITGGFQPKLSQGNLNQIPIPLPPLKDQEKIVKFLRDFEGNNLKSDGYYFDRKVEQKIIILHHSQLKGFKISTELTHQLSLLKKLRQQLLQDAMQGKLVALNKKDEPASELLKKIKAEKEKLINAGKLKKEKELPTIKEDEIPFEIPGNWVWCRLGEIIEFTDNLNIETKLSSDTLINYVDIDAIDNQKYEIKDIKLRTVAELSSRARRVLRKGYIAYSLVRPYLNNIAIIEDEKSNYIGSTGLAVFNGILIDNKFLKNILLSDYIRKLYLTKFSGFNSPSITQEQFTSTLVPLPPFSEQQLIIEKIDVVMHNCNELEESIKQSATQNEKLLQQVLREALRN